MNYANGAFDDERAPVFDPSHKMSALSSKRKNRECRVSGADESSLWWKGKPEK